MLLLCNFFRGSSKRKMIQPGQNLMQNLIITTIKPKKWYSGSGTPGTFPFFVYTELILENLFYVSNDMPIDAEFYADSKNV